MSLARTGCRMSFLVRTGTICAFLRCCLACSIPVGFAAGTETSQPLRVLFSSAAPYSHQLIFRKIEQELSDRGHSIRVSPVKSPVRQFEEALAPDLTDSVSGEFSGGQTLQCKSLKALHSLSLDQLLSAAFRANCRTCQEKQCLCLDVGVSLCEFIVQVLQFVWCAVFNRRASDCLIWPQHAWVAT